MASSPRKRRQRGHDVLPAGFQWRDGRPRWIPSPSRRAAGWRGVDLKDAWGKWLPRARAIERAEEIARAVDAWAKGGAVPSQLIHIAPPGSDLAAASQVKGSPRSIRTLLEAYYATNKFKGGGRVKGLAPKTQADYRHKHNRFFEAMILRTRPELAGEALAQKVARLKALDIGILTPPMFGETGDNEIELAIDWLSENAGLHMAAGCLAAVSAWLGWCVKTARIWPTNPATSVEKPATDGRIRVATWDEIKALVAAAEAMNMPSIADAIILAIDLSWAQQDILALRWDQVSTDHRIRHRRIKTGQASNPPLLAIGRGRIAKILQRQADMPAKPMNVVVCERTGQAWTSDQFRRKFAEVRARAAKDCPSVTSFNFADTRDTAITIGIDAGLSTEQICSRSQHSPDRAAAIHAKHYGQIRQGVADKAGETLDAHFKEMGYVL